MSTNTAASWAAGWAALTADALDRFDSIPDEDFDRIVSEQEAAKAAEKESAKAAPYAAV